MDAQIRTESELREILGEPHPRIRDKDRDRLDDVHRIFIESSPFCLVATSGADGSCDVSPKGDPAGQLAVVLDERRLALAERPGNRRADGFVNLLANPHIGLIFIIPGRGDTLRVNGRARLLRAAPYSDLLEVKGHRPQIICEVEVEQVFFHCSKAFLRSELWDPRSWDPQSIPSRAHIAHASERSDQPLDDVIAHYESPSYATGLYA
ncbi:pyridoxamine 5'-phosphate oxidase [Aeromicrobium sp. PE09-221]|uniref:MSMEG_1061 family FMN-dependent PPOX-type flavoprotein n=1 Tax=Aeromicrobium sp. PE09-221 TaxID=1898043 RepID=UPI000B3EB64C|nr:MSMEG_1061 family FMN-dependent PPOX-type flavoprotein [Aeromicrobium sp. PE09-221]OUZ08381.1 pyridoxamine 5'-phosphate oxidase [Aeromicrobium sp. PE09-221]